MSQILGQLQKNSANYYDFIAMLEALTLTSEIEHTPNLCGKYINSANGVYLGVNSFHTANLPNQSEEQTNNPYFSSTSEPAMSIFLDGYLQATCSLTERSLLEKRGVTLETPFDSELLLLMYREYGIDFLQKIDGVFALAIWDSRQQLLLLARDHLGQRPLYYFADPNRLLFASHLRAIIRVKDIPKHLNSVALQRYLFYQNVPEPLSIIQDIYKLPQGHYAIYHDGQLKINRWWNYDFNVESEDVSENEWRERIATSLPSPIKAAAQLNLRIGTFLSGGIDSSIITGLAAEFVASSGNEFPVHSFSIGFEHSEYNEADTAKQTAARLQTQHEENIVSGGIVEILPKLAWYYDEPFADSSMVPVWHLMQLAAGKTDMIFCGDGGDELFAGYLRHYAICMAHKFDVIPCPIRRLIGGPLQRMLPALPGQKSKLRRAKRFLEAIGFDSLERYAQWVTLYNRERLASLFSKDFAAQLTNENPLDCYQQIQRLCPDRDLVSTFSIIDLLAGISCNAMVKVGVAAEAHGIECRYPFLTREMVEMAFQIPSRFKRRGKTGKTILRQIYRRFLPPELEKRPKMGFGAPLDHWLRSGPLADHAWELLTDPQTVERGYFQQQYIERLLTEHKNSVFDHAYRIWALLMFEYWHRTHF